MKTLDRADKLATDALNVMDEIEGKEPAAEVLTEDGAPC